MRQGKRSAAVIVPPGYGEAADRVFHGAPRRIELELDPARTAEGAMLEGILTGAAMASMQDLFTDPARSRAMVARTLSDLDAAPPGPQRDAARRLLGEVNSFVDAGPAPDGGGTGWKPLEIVRREVRNEKVGPRSAFDFTFPQGILWGVIGCGARLRPLPRHRAHAGHAAPPGDRPALARRRAPRQGARLLRRDRLRGDAAPRRRRDLLRDPAGLPAGCSPRPPSRWPPASSAS